MYLPIINRVWASSPGKAAKNKPTTGKRTNSKVEKIFLYQGLVLLSGRARKSMKTITIKLANEAVRMADATWGKVLPKIVRAKSSFNSGGSVAPRVITN